MFVYIDTAQVFLARTIVYSLLTIFFLPLSAAAQSSVNLAWDASDDASVTGYNVHYGPSSGSYQNVLDAGNSTTAAVSNLPSGTSYFAVTAYNSDGLESVPSNEVAFTPNQAPTVTLANAGSADPLAAPATISLTAEASDPDGTIARVDFYEDGAKIGESAATPYNFNWGGVPSGTYTFTAIAFDDLGTSTTSTPVTVNVVNATSSPPSLGEISFNSNGVGQITVTGEAGNTYTLYVSNDMVNWTVLTTVQSTGSSTVFNDSGAAAASRRFYKIADSSFTSDASGFCKLVIGGISNRQTSVLSYLGIPLTNPVSYAGTISSFQGQTITDAGARWTDAQFSDPNGDFYLELTSGSRQGMTADIVSTNGTSNGLALTENISSVLIGGERFVIRKHRTLGDVFGLQNEAGLKSGATLALSDEVRIFNPVHQNFLQFYYQSAATAGGAGWRSGTDSFTDASSTILYLEQGLVISRKAAGNITLLVTGSVKMGPTLVPIGQNSNLIPNMYPAGSLTLQNAGLYTGDGSLGITSGSSAKAADEVQVQVGNSLQRFYYRTGYGWRRSGDSATDAGPTQLLPGTSFYVIRKLGRSGFNWLAPQPF